MNQLLAKTIDAHGGLAHWNDFHHVQATIVSGSGFFRLKGILQASAPVDTDFEVEPATNQLGSKPVTKVDAS